MKPLIPAKAVSDKAIELQPASEADYPAVIALTNRAFRGTGPEASWNVEDVIQGDRITDELLREDLAKAPGGHLLIWRDADGDHLGHVRLEPRADGVWYLALLTVRPDRQDQQLGRRLLAASEDFARARGGTRIRMTVVNTRETLIAWYLRRGYALTGETLPFPYHDERIGRPTRDDLSFVVLERDL
ncbi:MAG: family N-acetyltransferase [Phenylobacterium sp.]|nr:family N-acetyltransferase [Phenylobacterium sp.]